MSESSGGAARARKTNQAFHKAGETRPDVGILILHVLTTDVEKDAVAASAVAFVRRLI